MRWLLTLSLGLALGCSSTDAPVPSADSTEDIAQPMDVPVAEDTPSLDVAVPQDAAPDAGPEDVEDVAEAVWQPPPPGWQPHTSEPLAIQGTVSVSHVAIDTAPSPWASGRGLDARADSLVVIDDHNGSVVFLDQQTGLAQATVAVGGLPHALVRGPDGAVFVSVRAAGTVVKIVDQAITATAQLGLEPYGLGLSADGQTLWVTDATADELVRLSASDLSVQTRRPTLRRPQAVVVGSDGAVYVTHRSHGVLRFEAEGEPDTLPLRQLAPGESEFGADIQPDLIASLASAATPAPDSDAVFVAHQRAYTGVTAKCTSYYDYAGCEQVPGAPVKGAITVLGETGKPSAAADGWGADILLSPADINHHPTRSLLFVADQANERVVAFSTARQDPWAGPVAVWSTPGGATAVTFDASGTTAWVRLNRTLSVGELDLSAIVDSSATLPLVAGMSRTAVYGPDPRDDAGREGQQLFEAAGSPIDNQRMACINCHPDGMDDGRTWFSNNGPRQTITLAERLEGTAPYGWTGLSPKLPGYIAGVGFRMVTVWFGQEREHLAQYASGLWMPPRPPVDTDAANRGQDIFFSVEAGCGGCHLKGIDSDGLKHAVPGFELEFNTPSLKGLALTAPYLHDGTAPTLEAVLDQTADWMGGSANLSSGDRADLVMYLRSL